MAKIVTATVTFTLHEELEDELEGTSSALYDRMLEMHIWRALEEGGIAKDDHARANVIKIED